jgi:primosomal protein N' (replication factor Y) (superfamily II helicase)
MTDSSLKLCRVAINSPVGDSLLTYLIPEEHLALKRGTIVEVPLGNRKAKGCLITSNQKNIEQPKGFKLKEINGPIINEVILSDQQLELLTWIASYYHYPLGPLIFETLPKTMKRPRPLNFKVGQGLATGYNLSNEQSWALSKILPAVGNGFSKWLLHGVTGSGKSVVFLELMRKALEQKKSVLYLLPEINLTLQFIDFFTEHLNCKIYSYNSSISNSDKYQLWVEGADRDQPSLIIGVRSSIFVPIKNLGLIIVDEEHDQSFKQDDRCPYNARDIAIKKASLLKIPIVLGSASPAVDTFKSFKIDLPNQYVKMTQRVGESQLPEIVLIDIRTKKAVDEDIWPLRQQSVEQMNKSLQQNKQVLVFVNKLGFAGFLQCRACGKSFDCPNCTTSLRVYKKRHSLECHVCDYKDVIPDQCDICGNMSMLQKGFGTEKLKEVLEHIYPDKRIERFDRDEVTTMKKVEQRLREFHDGTIDILVGTQMLSKGHNFEKVDLVIILGIDAQLNFPDYRSHERVYQQLTQVSGRSGRYGGESLVVVQTLNPDNEIFEHVVNHSFTEFYDNEIEMREQCDSPPYSKLVMIYVTGKNQNIVIKESKSLGQSIGHLIKKHFSEVKVLGPRPALMEKRINKYTWALMLKSTSINQLHNLLKTVKSGHRSGHTISVKYDVDPYFLS